MGKALFRKKWFQTLFWVLVVIAAWEIGASVVAITKRTPENVMPHLYQIVAAAFSMKQVSGGMTATMVVMVSAEATLLRALVGFIFGALIGFCLALIMKLSGFLEKMLFPYLMLIQLIPVLGLAPIILSMTGDINQSRVIIAAILSFYPVATNTLAGLMSVPKEQYDLMYTYAAKKRQLYAKVLIPSSLPYMFTGLKIAAPMAITASILVDTLQGDGGLGCMLSQSLKHAMSIYVFWLIVFFSAFAGIASSYLIGGIEQLLLPQKRAQIALKMKERRERRERRKHARSENQAKKEFSTANIRQ